MEEAAVEHFPPRTTCPPTSFLYKLISTFYKNARPPRVSRLCLAFPLQIPLRRRILTHDFCGHLYTFSSSFYLKSVLQW